MNFRTIALMLALSFFTGAAIAGNEEGWVYKEKQENLKSTPGCETREIASAQAQSPYRVKKYAQMICQYDGYGWTLAEIKEPGTLTCDECDGDNKGKYSCYLANVKVECKTIKRGF